MYVSFVRLNHDMYVFLRFLYKEHYSVIFLSLSTGFRGVLCEMQKSLIQDPVSVVLEGKKMSWLCTGAE